jgi:stage II sporulation protein D
MWLLGWAGAMLAAGCTPTVNPPSAAGPTVEIIRVRLVPGVSEVDLSATGRPRLSIEGETEQRELIFPPDGPVAAARAGGGWRIGSLFIAGGVLTLTPDEGGLLSVNNSPYRGALRLVPVGQGQFDVINDVQIDDYLQGVLARELYRDWHIETYRAQAVVARTYALYQSHTDGLGRYWDVWADERSQVYGGVASETDKSRQAARETAGLVLAYGPGDGKIFQAFFSSDCGGVTQSASDAFGIAAIPPLMSHPEPECGKASPYFNWGPISVSREELTRRVRLWGQRRSPQRPEEEMSLITNVELAGLNPYGRPTKFKVTDDRGTQYILSAEEMRSAFNTDAPAGGTLPSSFCKVGVPAANPDVVVFFDGHGLGHGVGMCQWCAQQRALEGESYEQILLSAYPQAKFARAY